MTDLAALQLRTLFEIDEEGFLVRNREPNPRDAPRLAIVRTKDSVAWGVRRDTPAEIVELAATEPPATDLRAPPVHAERYVEILGGAVVAGPAYVFPSEIESPQGVELTSDPGVLGPLFTRDEIEARSPIYAVVEGGRAVSLCHCARLADDAAEAGLYTHETHRGRGLGPLVTAAWAEHIRASGRIPLYSTSWTNASSQRVAAKLGLRLYATDFSVT